MSLVKEGKISLIRSSVLSSNSQLSASQLSQSKQQTAISPRQKTNFVKGSCINSLSQSKQESESDNQQLLRDIQQLKCQNEKLQKQIELLNHSNLQLSQTSASVLNRTQNCDEQQYVDKNQYQMLLEKLADYEEINSLLDSGNYETTVLLNSQLEQISNFQAKVDYLEDQLRAKSDSNKDEIIRNSIIKIQQFQDTVNVLESEMKKIFAEKQQLSATNKRLLLEVQPQINQNTDRQKLLDQIEKAELQLQWAEANANADKVQKLQNELDALRNEKHSNDLLNALKAQTYQQTKTIQSLQSRNELQAKRIKGLELQNSKLVQRLKRGEIDQNLSQIQIQELTVEKEAQELETRLVQLTSSQLQKEEQINKEAMEKSLKDSQVLFASMQKLRQATQEQSEDQLKELLQSLDADSPAASPEDDAYLLKIKDLEERCKLIQMEYESFKQLALLKDQLAQKQRDELMAAAYKKKI